MLRLDGVEVRYDDQPAVSGVDLTVADGEVLAVLGPSGCGKSTLLRAVAGLEPLAAGAVAWDGADLAGVPAHRRGFVLMFQDGQLFDHLTVARNVGYALRSRGRAARESRSQEDARVRELLAAVGLTGQGERMPRTLSGGERQRVALARSLAASPRLLLLDEPLTALDAELRLRLAADLRELLADSTALLVTHDQAEAYALADRVAVMREGRIVQQGTVAEVWSAPIDAPTALFLGYSRVITGAAARTLLASLDGARSPGSSPSDSVGSASAEAVETAEAVAVRRSAVRAVPDPAATGESSAEVLAVQPTPDELHLTVRWDGVGELEATGSPTWLPAVGDRVGLHVARDRIAILPGTADAEPPPTPA